MFVCDLYVNKQSDQQVKILNMAVEFIIFKSYIEKLIKY